MSELIRIIGHSVGARQLENSCLEKQREAVNSGATLKRLLLDRCGNLSVNENNDCKYAELLVHNHHRKKITPHWRMLENHLIILKTILKNRAFIWTSLCKLYYYITK